MKENSATTESPGETTALSSRGREMADRKDFLDVYKAMCRNNPFHPTTNVKGIINMGTAVNRVMEKELTERLAKGDALRFGPEHQHYYSLWGVPELRKAAADTLTRHLTPDYPVSSDDLAIMNGATSCLDALAYALCDPGDIMITPTPVYARIFADFKERCKVDVQPIVCRSEPDAKGESFRLRLEAVEAKVEETRACGRQVRALLLVNPSNPLGDIYPPDLILDLMKLCAKHQIHFICDEIYALSVFDEEASFHSVLAFRELPDPERTHVVWAMSKDFGLAGFRTGVIHTRNASVMKCLKALSTFQCTPHLIQHAAAALLSDQAWCDDFYLKTNRRRLRDRYAWCAARLKSAGVTVRKAKAGLFLWFDLGPFLRERTKEDEMDLFRELLERGTYVVPGTQFYCEDPGWFRAIFAVSEVELEEGFKRILQVLDERKRKDLVQPGAA